MWGSAAASRTLVLRGPAKIIAGNQTLRAFRNDGSTHAKKINYWSNSTCVYDFFSRAWIPYYSSVLLELVKMRLDLTRWLWSSLSLSLSIIWPPVIPLIISPPDEYESTIIEINRISVSAIVHVPFLIHFGGWRKRRCDVACGRKKKGPAGSGNGKLRGITSHVFYLACSKATGTPHMTKSHQSLLRSNLDYSLPREMRMSGERGKNGRKESK